MYEFGSFSQPLHLRTHPGLSAAPCIAAAGHRLSESSVLAVRPDWVLRIFFQISDAVQPLLIAQFDPAEIQARLLHGRVDFLALAGLLPVDHGREDANQQMQACVAVAESGSAYYRRAVPEPGGRG